MRYYDDLPCFLYKMVKSTITIQDQRKQNRVGLGPTIYTCSHILSTCNTEIRAAVDSVAHTDRAGSIRTREPDVKMHCDQSTNQLWKASNSRRHNLLFLHSDWNFTVNCLSHGPVLDYLKSDYEPKPRFWENICQMFRMMLH